MDVCRYESMMVVRADLAMFTLRCPHCKATVSSMQPIPPQLYEEVRFAALEVGAGVLVYALVVKKPQKGLPEMQQSE